VALLAEALWRGVGDRLADALLDAVQLARDGFRQLPSSAIYFSEPLADLIGARFTGAARPIRRLSPNVFVCGGNAVVVRYAGPRQIAMIERRRFGRVYLVVDDDFAALHDQDGLPADYRRRLLRYRDGAMARLLDKVTHVVAPSDRILSRYRGKSAIRLDPAQCHGAADLAHHRDDGGLDIVFAGTRSHLHDLDHVAESIAEFLRVRPDARLTTFLNGHAPKVLKNLGNAINHPAMSWPDYRAFVARNRFHVAIAPAMDTEFNRARSFNKLHDHAAYGAAGLYSRQAPFDMIVDHEESGLLLANDPGCWRDALFDLAGRRDRVRAIAAAGQDLSRRLGSQLRVREFWLRELGLN
jgi:hypothetical protein